MNINVFSAVFLLCAANVHAAYNSTTAANYAVTNYNVSYGATTNPFINVGGVGGNCTNFGNQSISGGLLGYTSAPSLNKALLTASATVTATQNASLFYKCNSVTNTCQSAPWRGAQAMFSYSSSSSQTKGARLSLVTKTALVNGSITVLDPKKIKVGDIVFADFDYVIGGTSNAVDHTTVVTEVRPESFWDITTTMKYNNIRLTYQSNNVTDKGMGDLGAKVLYGWSQD